MSETQAIYLALAIFGLWLAMFNRRVNHVERTMIGIQATMQHLPSKDDVHRIEKSVDALRIEVAAAREADAGLRTAIGRIDQALMHTNRKDPS